MPFASFPPAVPPANAPIDALNTNTPFNWREWFYTGGTSRVRLDPNPPLGRTDLMAHYFLPGCSDFQVEFTYDDPHEIAIQRTDPNDANSPGSFEPILFNWYDMNGDGAVDQAPTPQPINWQSVPNGEVWVWNHLGPDQTAGYAATPGDLRDLTQPYRWPRAIRITIRAYDPAGRLPDPIVHTIVHTFR